MNDKTHKNENKSQQKMKHSETDFAENPNTAQFYATVANVSINMRKADWTYLCRHPEIRAIIRVILMEAVKQHPKNFHKFTADLFDCKNVKTLVVMINKQLKWVNEQLKRGAWSSGDGEMLFTDSSDSSYTAKKHECPKSFVVNDDECPDLFKNPLICPENFKPSCLD